MRHVAFRTTSVALTIALSAIVLTVSAPPAKAWVSGTLWNPGLIISDQQFFDGDAMSTSQIQSFLNGKVPTCHPEWSSGPNDPIVCLKDYRQTTQSRAADGYCPNAYVGGSNESAATIISKVARACDISPKVILVTLQKEVGLVTHSSPSTWRYDRAMGFGCSDTAPCIEAYQGFFKQVYTAARQFQRYRLLPTSYNYRAGVTNRIGYHPNASCGTQSVYIQNSATAGLYNYTPYVPNSAALSAIPNASSNSCSSYGNRNFFMYYWEWFGSPTTQSSLMTSANTGKTYLIAGNARYWVNDKAMIADLAPLGSSPVVSADTLLAMDDGGMFTGVVKTGSSTYALIESGKKHPFTSCAMVEDFGASCTGMPQLTSTQYGKFTISTTMQNLVRYPDGNLWFVEDGVRREALDNASLTLAGLGTTYVNLRADRVEALALGAPIVRPDVIIRNPDDDTYRISIGSTLHMIDADLGADLSLGAIDAGVLHTESIALLPRAAPALGAVVTYQGNPWLLSARGRHQVAPALVKDIGGALALTAETATLFPVRTAIGQGDLLRLGPGASRYAVIISSTLRVGMAPEDAVTASGTSLGSAIVVPARSEADLKAGPFLVTRSSSWSVTR